MPLNPGFDAQTCKLHHQNTTKTYVDKLNIALENYPQFNHQPIDQLLKKLDTLPEAIRTPVKNHGGGHANHSLFWQILSPKAQPEPSNPLLEGLNQSFGSFSAFKTEFSKHWCNHFGSGWAWAGGHTQPYAENLFPPQPRLPPVSRRLPALKPRCLGTCLLP